MPFQIRPAKPEDASNIAHVQVESWKTTYTGIVPGTFLAYLTREAQTESWRAPLANPAIHFFVAEDETGIFGFATGGAIREAIDPYDAYDAELYAIYLLKSHQHYGAGRALVRTLAAALHGAGFQSMIVWALEENPAIGFYQRLGAVPLARKITNIGGKDLPDLVLGWSALLPLLQ